MYKKLPLVISLVGLVALLGLPVGLAPTPALAYEGCATAATATANPVLVNPGGSVTFTVTLRDCNGNGLAGINVVFGAGNDPCGPTFTPPSTTTDANGVATTTVFFPGSCTCLHTLSATGGGVTVTADVRVTKCLPFTAAKATASVAAAPPLLPGLIALAGGLFWWLGAGWAFAGGAADRRLSGPLRRGPYLAGSAIATMRGSLAL